MQTIFVRFRDVSGNIVGSAQGSIDLIPSGTMTSTSSISSMSSSSLQALIAQLQAQLQSLLAQAAAITSSAVSVSSSSSSHTFTRDLKSGMTGSDVTQLQQYLIKANSGPAARKLKAYGTTTNFGTLTQAALIEFQKKNGIKPASGYFGAITRAYVNSHP
jgi:peptidoglycan hydrolase-like protein with peptidoglycan-binding domain